MHLEVTETNWYDGRKSSIEIKVDGKRVFRVFDGDERDNNLMRNFCNCYLVADLMRLAHQEGKNGEELTFGEKKVLE